MPSVNQGGLGFACDGSSVGLTRGLGDAQTDLGVSAGSAGLCSLLGGCLSPLDHLDLES